MTEVGSAYVRLRPSLTGFKAETEAGVGSAFSGIGKIIGGAFAAAGAFHFGKEAITGAADLQKQVEAVKVEFGAAAKSVLDFGTKGAAGLGLTEHAADSASAKFGLLLKNIGLAPNAAAEMTVGLEQTAGALGRIKNIDPGTVLQGLTAALRGQGRGLAQFGIVLDQNTVKLEAFNLGLIHNAKDALTPAQKAIAAYALITAHLPQYLDQAKAHSGDFANVLTDFKVAAADASENLGKRLLPAATAVFKALGDAIPTISRLAGETFDALKGAVVSLLAPFGGARKVVDDLRDSASNLFDWLGRLLAPIGGVKAAVVALIAVFAVDKILSFASALKDKVAGGAFGALQQQARQSASSVEDANTVIQQSAIKTQTAFSDIASAGEKTFSGIDVLITQVSASLTALGVDAEATVAKLRSVGSVPIRTGAAAVAATPAAQIAASAEALAPAAAVGAGFEAENITRAGADLAIVLEQVQDQAKKTAEAVKSGFDGSSVEDYTGHLKEVVDKVGEVRTKALEAGSALNTDLGGGAKAATTSLAATGAAGTHTTEKIVSDTRTATGAFDAQIADVQAALGSITTGVAQVAAQLTNVTADAAAAGTGVAGSMTSAFDALRGVNTAASGTAISVGSIGAGAATAAREVEVASAKMAADLRAVAKTAVLPPAITKAEVSQFGRTPPAAEPFKQTPEWQAAHQAYLARLAALTPPPVNIDAGKNFRAEIEKLTREAEQNPLQSAGLRQRARAAAAAFSGPTEFGGVGGGLDKLKAATSDATKEINAKLNTIKATNAGLRTSFSAVEARIAALGAAGAAVGKRVAAGAEVAGAGLLAAGREAALLGPLLVAGTAEGAAGFFRLGAAADAFKAAAVEAGAAATASVEAFGAAVKGIFLSVKEFSKQVFLFALIIGLTEAYNRSQKFHDAVNSVFASIRDKLLPVIEKLYARLHEPLGNALKGLVAGLGAAVPVVEHLISVFSHLPLEVKAVGAAVAGLLILLSGGGLIPAVLGLGFAFVEAYKHSETFREVVKGALDGIKTAFDGARTIVERWKDGFESLSPLGKRIIEVIAGVTAGVILLNIALLANPVGVVVVAIGALIVGLIEAYKHFKLVREVFDDLGTVFKAVGSVIKDDVVGVVAVVEDLFQVLRGAFEVFEGVVTLNWRKTWQGIKDIFEGFAKAIIDVFKTWIRVVGDLLTGFWHAIEITFLEGIEKIAGVLAKIPTKIKIFGVTIGTDNPFKSWDGDLKATIGDLQAQTPEAHRAGQKLADAFTEPFLSNIATIQKAIADALALASNVQAPGATDVSTGGHTDESKQVAKDAAAYAKSVAAAAKTVFDQLKAANTAGDVQVKALRSHLSDLHTSLTEALKQETDDVNSAVSQAKSNLASIADTLAGDIGQILDKPLQDAQNKITAFQNKQNLRALARSVLLPGGKALSDDPKKGLAQLQDLQRHASASTRGALDDFVGKYRAALLQVEQDKVNQVKTAAQQRLDDLAYAFTHGKISSKKFTEGLVAELKRDHVSFKSAGVLLGTAFAGGFKDAFEGAVKQANALGTAVKGGISLNRGSDIQIVRPLDVLHKDQLNVEKIHREIGNQQIKIQTKTEANTKKVADLTEQLLALQKASGTSSKTKAPGRQAATSTALTPGGGP